MSRCASAACVARVRPRVERPTVASGSARKGKSGGNNVSNQVEKVRQQWYYTVGMWEPDKNWNEIASAPELEEAMEIASALNATLKGYSG